MKHYWMLNTTKVLMADGLTHDTGLPGDPQGSYSVGYAATKKELQSWARLDRSEGGHPTITKVERNADGTYGEQY